MLNIPMEIHQLVLYILNSQFPSNVWTFQHNTTQKKQKKIVRQMTNDKWQKQ
jgi:hypothetical protein